MPVRTLLNSNAPTSRLPAYAVGHSGPYDHRTSIYNATGPNMRLYRAHLARARGLIAPVRMVWIGTSGTAGYLTDAGTDDPVAQTREVFKQAGFPCGELVWCSSNSAGVTLDNRISLGGWSQPGTGKVTATSNSSVLTYTSLAVGTVVEILCTGNSATFTYAIDGGAPTSVTATGSVMRLVTVTGLANTAHTVTVTGPTSGTATLVAVGVRATNGLTMANAALSGATTATWLGTNVFSDPINIVTALTPAVAVVELGGNDIGGGVSLATYTANLTSIIAKLQTAGTFVFLVAGTETYAAATTWLDAMYGIADAKSVPLLDLQDAAGTTAADLKADPSHANAAGYAGKVLSLAELLAIPRRNV